MIKFVDVNVTSVDVVQKTNSMRLLSHTFEYRDKLFVALTWVPNRLLSKPYCWAYPSSKRKDNGSSS